MKISELILIYILLINLIAFYFYWNDKRRAKINKWRIPENTLLLIALIGGSIGALLGMKVFRHKTKHWKFKICVPLSIILHIAGIIMLIIYIMRALG